MTKEEAKEDLEKRICSLEENQIKLWTALFELKEEINKLK